MKKIAVTILCFSAFMAAAFVPGQAEALKINVEPSVTFRQSYDRVYVQPRRIVRPPCFELQEFIDPVTGGIHYVYVPCQQRVIVGQPNHFRARSAGTDYQLRLRLR